MIEGQLLLNRFLIANNISFNIAKNIFYKFKFVVKFPLIMANLVIFLDLQAL